MVLARRSEEQRSSPSDPDTDVYSVCSYSVNLFLQVKFVSRYIMKTPRMLIFLHYLHPYVHVDLAFH